MAFSEIKARLGLDIGPFKKGMAGARKDVAKTSEAMSSFAGKILGPIAAVTSLAAALTASFYRARDLRDEAELMGESVSNSTQRLAEQADALDEMMGAIRSGLAWMSEKLLWFFDKLADGAQEISDVWNGMTLEQSRATRKLARETEAASLKEERIAKKRMTAAKDALRSEERSKQLAADIVSYKKILGITEEKIAETIKEEADIIERMESVTVDLVEAEDDRLDTLREEKAILMQQRSIIEANLATKREELAAARAAAANPQGITTQELAGMNPYDSRFGFSLKARRRIQGAQQALGLREQARFAEVGGNTGKADRLLSKAADLEGTALNFRSKQDINQSVAQIAKEVSVMSKHLNSIDENLQMMEVEE